MNLQSGAIVSGGITFSGSGGQLQIAGSAMPSSTISGFVPGDTFDLASIAFISGGSAIRGANNQLQITEGGTTVVLNLDPRYCRGTLIRTITGEVPVEALAIGDKVITLSGLARPIKWIGHRSYSGRFALGQRQILPVCVKAGALDDRVPRRDLWVSPNHALYLEGVLIGARDLVNGVSIVQAEAVAAIEYFHVELASHDVLVAEGTSAESFIDDDSRALFHNAHEYWALYPDEAAGPAQYCAPRRKEGVEVERARAAIARRAGLRVAIDGRRSARCSGRSSGPGGTASPAGRWTAPIRRRRYASTSWPAARCSGGWWRTAIARTSRQPAAAGTASSLSRRPVSPSHRARSRCAVRSTAPR